MSSETFVKCNLISPIQWLGRDDDWEIIVAMGEGRAGRQ